MFKRWFSRKDKSTTPDSKVVQTQQTKLSSGIMPVWPVTVRAQSAANTVSIPSYIGPLTVGTNLHSATSVVTFHNNNSGEIVRLNKDGTIVWANGIDVDAAAEAFGRSITLGAEMVASITEGVKHRMRDSIFADLIEIAREKGSLTADDLTYLLEASKIVEKLKGGKE